MHSAADPRLPTRILRTTAIVFVLLVAPLLFLCCTFKLIEKRGPLWLGSNSDPSYCYLLNTLLILNGQPVFHVDHPGTPAQIGGAIILRAQHPSLSVAELNKAVLTQPETALGQIIVTVNCVTAGLLFLFGLLLWRLQASLTLGVLFQFTLLFFDQTYFNSVYFTPEIFFPPFCLCLAYVYFCAHLGGPTRYFPVYAGVLTALCLMLKITFLPFVALGLFAFSSRQAKLFYLAALLVTLSLFAYYLRHELVQIGRWFFNLTTHSGQYGGGPQNIVDWPRYWPALGAVLKADPPYRALLISGLAVPLLTFVIRPLAEAYRSRTNRLLLVLVVLETGCFLLTAKHPAAHYLMPLVAMAPLHLVLLGSALKTLLPYKPVYVVAISLLVLWGSYAGSKQYRFRSGNFAQGSASQVEARAKLTDWLAGKAKEPSVESPGVTVHYYRNSSVEYALFFGNGYARGYFSPQLAKIYPDIWFFNIFNARFQNFAELITGEEFYSRHPQAVFFGSNSIESMPFGLEFPLPAHGTLKQIWKNEQAAIHEIEYR